VPAQFTSICPDATEALSRAELDGVKLNPALPFAVGNTSHARLKLIKPKPA